MKAADEALAPVFRAIEVYDRGRWWLSSLDNIYSQNVLDVSYRPQNFTLSWNVEQGICLFSLRKKYQVSFERRSEVFCARLFGSKIQQTKRLPFPRLIAIWSVY